MAKAKIKVEKYGIKETKELLQLGFALGKSFKAAKEDDGNLSMGDMKHLIAIYPQVTIAYEDASKIPAELKDLSKDEVKELLVFSAAHLGEFAGADEELMLKIEKALNVGLAILEFIKVL
jgi:ubiquitin